MTHLVVSLQRNAKNYQLNYIFLFLMFRSYHKSIELEVFVTRLNGFQLLVNVTKDSVLDVSGGPISSAVYSFLLKFFCFAFLVLIIIYYDCNKLMVFNVSNLS